MSPAASQTLPLAQAPCVCPTPGTPHPAVDGEELGEKEHVPLWAQTSPFCTVRSEALASPLSAPGHVLTTAQPVTRSLGLLPAPTRWRCGPPRGSLSGGDWVWSLTLGSASLI